MQIPFKQIPLALASLLLLPACSSVQLEPVNFAWPVESVLTVGSDNAVTDGRNAVSFNIGPVSQEEFQDSTALKGATIRLIRSKDGYYFLTGHGFKHVYVLTPAEGALTTSTRIEVAQQGLNNPAMNQRVPYIELLDDNNFHILLSSDDIVKEDNQ